MGQALFEWSKRRCLVRLEMDSRDDAFRWMMYWLMRQPSFRSSNVLSVTTSLKSFGTSPVEESMVASGAAGAPYMLLPAPGEHVMRYRGAWVLVSRQRAAGNPQLAANARLLMETLRLSTPAYSRPALLAMLEEARAAYEASQMQRTSVFAVDNDGYWAKIGSRPVRPLSSVLLPPGQAEAILADCRDFLASEAWYAHRGIPYRRGYLLYGLPGTGKTSLVTALAGELGCHLYVVSLSSPRMTDEALGSLLTSSEEGSILLLEDVDAAFLKRDRVAGAAGGAGGLSFSGLLNAIDGVAAQEGRMLFMTTNHLERLSEALVRPGRVDVRLQFGWATEWQKYHLFTSFYAEDSKPEPQDAAACGSAGQRRRDKSAGSAAEGADAALNAQAVEFCRQLAGVEVSMAQLQGFLMRFKGDPEGAVRYCGRDIVCNAAPAAGSLPLST